MLEPDLSGFRALARSHARLKIAGILLVFGLLFAVFAFRVESKQYLTSQPSGQHSATHYVRMWFDVADALVGAYWQENQLVVERWSGSNPSATWRFELPEADHEHLIWAMAGDTSRIAWIENSTLHIRRSASGSKPVDVPLSDDALALTFNNDGAVAVVLDNLAVERRDAATGRMLGKWQAPLRSAERAAAQGNDVAFSSMDEGKLTVFTLRGEQWGQTAQVSSPELPERIVMPAPSAIGTMMEGRLRVDGITRRGPGSIRSVAAHLHDVFAAGDFDGIYVLPPEGEFYRLADAAPGSVLAAGQSSFAIGGNGGTTLFSIGSEDRLSPIGRKISYAAIGLVTLAAVLTCLPLLLGAVMFSSNFLLRPKSSSGIPQILGKPPVDLVKACASGRMILWAGAGLSAQSGFPVRARFIETLIKTAALDFGDLGAMKKLMALCASGKAEAALNQLVASMSANRMDILSQFTAIFARFSPPSRSHDLLARLNLHSAVTTNYDVLLERTPDAWADNVRHLGADTLEGRFLLKLYGSLSVPSTALLSRAEFEAAMDRPNLEMLRQIFDAQPMLLIGCSLDALLADLKMMSMPEGDVAIRYVVTGTSGNWNKAANELLQRYGIKALVCAEEKISEELPKFLQLLAGDLQQLQRSEQSFTTSA